ncbi:MAG: tetratricopeptide repeat protein, partial [Verrucomicrobiota bacterium]
MPEKEISDIPAPVRDLYDKGVAALQKNNLDYAVTLFGQAVRLEPAFFDARQALRAAQHRRTGARGGGLFRKFIGSASSLTKGQLALRNHPAEALNVAEEALNDDPVNPTAHQLVADAAMALDLPKTAALSLDIVFKNNPRDRRLAARLAEALAGSGQRARAERIYRDLLAADPTDVDLNEKLKNLLADRTLVEGRYETFGTETSSYRDLIRDKEEAVTLEQESRAVKDTDVADRLIREYEARLEREGDNLKLMRDTAALYEKKRDHAGAIRWYQRILEVGGIQDPLILKSIQDARLAGFEARRAAVAADAPDREAALAALVQERQAFLLEDARRRADANPTDLLVRHELG